MKKVLLIGDSIRKGYDAYTRDRLAGVAEVLYPEENCRFAEYVLRYLIEWSEQLGVGAELDVIHWNAGLWDCLRLYGEGTLTPVDIYARFIEKIQQRIVRFFPNAKVIFATSTPVVEHLWPDPRKAMRYNADIEAYNAAALAALEPYHVYVDDLYALMKDVPESMHSDQTHFYTPEGTKRIGEHVSRLILDVLSFSDESALKTAGSNYAPDSVLGI